MLKMDIIDEIKKKKSKIKTMYREESKLVCRKWA